MKNPVRVLPRVIVITLMGVLALYAAIVVTLLGSVGAEVLAGS